MSNLCGGVERRACVMETYFSDEVVEKIFSCLDNPTDRKAVSEVCRQWKRVDSDTRKEVRVANCYSVTPTALSKRFHSLESLKIRGKPRAADFGLMPENWGGYAEPWVHEVARAYGKHMKHLHLRRMDVQDADLKLLSQSCSELRSLKLHKCSGFSTGGLQCITSSCRLLQVLYMEDSEVRESEMEGAWLRDLAKSNPRLEELNFSSYEGRFQVQLEDLELLVDNCKFLKSLKVSHEINFLDMASFLKRATSLSELGTGFCRGLGDDQAGRPMLEYPRTIVSLCGLYDLADRFLPFPPALLVNLKSLDLQYCDLTPAVVAAIVRHCSNLESLKVTNDILGDDGLIAIAEACKGLKQLVVQDRYEDPYEGSVTLTPAGIIPLVQNCVKLQHLVLYVSDLNAATLAAVGASCPEMRDCRFVLLDHIDPLSGRPLDEGVKSLLQGCQNLQRFALFVRHGALTDNGLRYIGTYGARLRWILLGRAGESDEAMSDMVSGCTALEKLEIRDCTVSESGLGEVACRSKRLKFIWAQGTDATNQGGKRLARCGRNWVVEYCTAGPPVGACILAYCSLAPPRTDHPRDIIVLPSDGDCHQIHENGGD